MIKQTPIDKQKPNAVCQQISIDSSLNITDELRKQKQENSQFLDTPNQKNKQQAMSQASQVSIQNQLANSSYTIIDEAEQDLLDQLDQLLQAHQNKRTNMNNKKLFKCTNKDDKDAHLYEKFERLLNFTNQQSTRNKTEDIINTPTSKQRNSVNQCHNNNNNNEPHLQQISIIQFHKQLEDVQKLIQQYRKQLDHYQNSLSLQITQSSQQKQLFKHNIDQMILKLETSQNIQAQQHQKIIMLTQQNSQLKAQLSKFISRSSRASKSKISNSIIPMKTKFRLNELHHLNLVDEQTQIFTQAVREQLQDMIESLLIQVQHLRTVNEKLKSEIKTLNRQLVESQKIIMKKNGIIYNLQMSSINKKKQVCINKPAVKLLKSSRSQPMIKSHITQSHHFDEPSIKYSLSDVINKKLQITNIEKIAIALKIIQCYEQKIDNKSYEMLMPEDLIIYQSGNRWQTLEVRPYLLSSNSSRCSQQRLSRDKKQNLIQNVLWNMNFILEQLFKKDESRKVSNLTDLIENTIRDKIDQIFQDKVGKKITYLQQLKQILKSSIVVEDP